jgi:hypothetical protein
MGMPTYESMQRNNLTHLQRSRALKKAGTFLNEALPAASVTWMEPGVP